jgi:ferric-dicitrate binding protein FerR (iron transport regulator)
MRCATARRLVDQRSSGLSEADRLRVEDHLAACEHCHVDAQLLGRLGKISERAAVELPVAARERSIERSLRTPTREIERVPPHSVWKWPLLAAAATAMVLAVGWWRLRPRDSLPPNVATTIEQPQTLRLAHAQVMAAPKSQLEWQPQQATVVLTAGAVDVAVDPAPHHPFRVRTPRFTVDVVGTEFHVDLDGVRVSHGRVRVNDTTLVAAGESWSVPAAAAVVPPPAAEPEPAVEPEPAAEPEPVAPRKPHGPSAARLLVLARAHLAAHDLAKADRDIAQALAAHPSRAEQAEAASLRAERAQVAGDFDRAARLYIETAARFSDLRAGENALFAAARVELKAKRNARAAELLREYLRRYPSGGFRAEAKTRLESLGNP